MDQSQYEQRVSIAVGVVIGFGLIYAFVQTWAWSRRAGKIVIDVPMLFKFILFACGNLANAFFATTLGAALWWLIFYKVRSLKCKSPR